MTIQEAIRTGNKIRQSQWVAGKHILVYEGNSFLRLSIGDILSYTWESEIVELPRLERLDEKSGDSVTTDPEGKTWDSRRGVWVLLAEKTKS